MPDYMVNFIENTMSLRTLIEKLGEGLNELKGILTLKKNNINYLDHQELPETKLPTKELEGFLAPDIYVAEDGLLLHQ